MKKISILLILITQNIYSQNFGEFPKIEKEKLQRDLDLLHQGLDKFHSGMYWYTPKDSVDFAFNIAKNKINSIDIFFICVRFFILRYNCLQRSGAWRGCELRNRLFSVKDKISCET